MRRAPLIIAGLVVVVVLGWLGYGTRNKPEAPALAALPSVAQSSAPSAARDPVVSDVQAAVPAAPVVADVSPTPSKIAPALPAPARPGVPPPRAMEPAPAGRVTLTLVGVVSADTFGFRIQMQVSSLPVGFMTINWKH